MKSEPKKPTIEELESRIERLEAIVEAMIAQIEILNELVQS